MLGREGAALRGVVIAAGLALGALVLAVAARFIIPALLPSPEHITETSGPALPADELSDAGDLAERDGDAAPPWAGTDAAAADVDGGAHVQVGKTTKRPHRPPSRPGKRDVVRVGPGRYVVQRAAIDNAIAEGTAKGATRAVRVTENGQPIGYRLHNVSPQLHQVGLRSGDIVMSVNGQKITSANAALAAYGGLRKTTRANVRLRRGGRPITLSYTIEGQP